MARKRKRDKEPESKGSGWLASYADTMTLLMTFFILLYSMASVDESKMSAMSNALQEILQGQKKDAIFNYDLDNGEAPIIGGEQENIEQKEVAQSEDDYTYEELKNYIEGNKLEKLMGVSKTERGVELQLSESVLFQSGKANLVSDSKDVLSKVSDVIKNTKSDIIVEGHTDDRPISTGEFPSNWELSSKRAVNVVKYFTVEGGSNPSRFSAVGYGEHRPIGDNKTVEGQSKNRRVTILFKSNEKKEG